MEGETLAYQFLYTSRFAKHDRIYMDHGLLQFEP